MPSSTTTPPPAETGFDPEVFWIQNRSKIMLLTGALVIGLGIFGISEYLRIRKDKASQELFAQADTAENYRKVISEYSGTVAAGNAEIMLAAKLRAEGKFDESTASLQAFIQKYPQHQLISGAWTSIASNQEAQGKVDEALATYQKVSTTYANSFSAPNALLGQARILAAKGKTEEARRIYEQVMTQFSDNMGATQQAAMEVRRLKK